MDLYGGERGGGEAEVRTDKGSGEKGRVMGSGGKVRVIGQVTQVMFLPH